MADIRGSGGEQLKDKETDDLLPKKSESSRIGTFIAGKGGIFRKYPRISVIVGGLLFGGIAATVTYLAFPTAITALVGVLAGAGLVLAGPLALAIPLIAVGVIGALLGISLLAFLEKRFMANSNKNLIFMRNLMIICGLAGALALGGFIVAATPAVLALLDFALIPGTAGVLPYVIGGAAAFVLAGAILLLLYKRTDMSERVAYLRYQQLKEDIKGSPSTDEFLSKLQKAYDNGKLKSSTMKKLLISAISTGSGDKFQDLKALNLSEDQIKKLCSFNPKTSESAFVDLKQRLDVQRFNGRVAAALDAKIVDAPQEASQLLVLLREGVARNLPKEQLNPIAKKLKEVFDSESLASVGGRNTDQTFSELTAAIESSHQDSMLAIITQLQDRLVLQKPGAGVTKMQKALDAKANATTEEKEVDPSAVDPKTESSSRFSWWPWSTTKAPKTAAKPGDSVELDPDKTKGIPGPGDTTTEH